MTRLLQTVLVVGAILIGTPRLGWAQISFYCADAYTTNTDQIRLFLDSGTPTQPPTPAPVGTTLWFVADTSNNGVPTGSVTESQIQGIVNGTGDDKRFFSDYVDGMLLGKQNGKYNRVSIPVLDSYKTANIIVFLWNDVNNNSIIGDAGDTYGILDLGVRPPPAVGNALYVIDSNIYADQNWVVVPEPSAYAAIFVAFCLCEGVVYVMRRRVKSVDPKI